MMVRISVSKSSNDNASAEAGHIGEELIHHLLVQAIMSNNCAALYDEATQIERGHDTFQAMDNV